MIYIILLLILAALLFGSSAVIGFLGLLLGFIVAAIAVVWASIAFDLDPIAIYFIIIGGAAAFFIFGAYCNRKANAGLDRMAPNERAAYDELRRKIREETKGLS